MLGDVILKKLILGVLSTLILTTNVLANEIETKKVISTGVGLTESEALKDTTRNAVQQVVGAYILSDTYVKNSQLIKDEILTNSNGFVKGFKIISQTKDDSGLIKIEAEVEVEPSNVTKRLGELNIVLKDVATTEFKAISLDKFQAVKYFKTMFDEIVLKPIKENKQIYDIKIGELKSVDKLPDYFDISNTNDELITFILSFSVDFNKEYIESVKSFLEKSSKNKYYYRPDKYDEISRKSIAFSNNDNSFKIVYELDNGLQTSLQTLLNNISSYEPIIFIKLLDINKQIIKNKIFKRNDMDWAGHPLKSKYHRVQSLFGLNEYDYKNLQFQDYRKDLELVMFLNEDEVSKIKSSSIEIKWEKK